MSNVTYIFAIEGMHCASCGLLVDDALEDLAGVERTSTSVKHARTVVVADPARCTPVDVMAGIAAVGYESRLLE